MKDKKRQNHYYYTIPELLGHLFMMALLIVSVTAMLRLVEVMVPAEPVPVIKAETSHPPITSVSTHLQAGYLSLQNTDSASGWFRH